MTVRTILRVGTTVTTMLVGLFIVVVFLFVFSVRRAYERQQVAERVLEYSLQLAMIRAEYMQNPGERAKVQWIRLYESSARLLSQNAPLFTEPPENELFVQLENSLMEIRPLFELWVRAVEGGKDATIVDEINNQMNFRTQIRSHLSIQLSDMSRRAVSAATSALMYAVLAFGVLVLGISIAMDIVSRNIARSIFMLGEGAKEIAGGNLAYQLPVQGDDEIAQVGQQFNVMARKLRQSHVILDQKVKDRTKEVSTILEALDRIALVSITDVKGNIVYANDRFVEVSKYDRHELMGKNHRILKSGKQPVALFVDLWDTICHGRVWRGEILNRAKDGTYYWVDTSIAPVLNDRGVPERYISVRFLITERKKAIEDLQKFQQAVAASSEAILILTVPDYAVTYVNSAWSRLTGYAAREALGRTLEYSRAVETDPRVLDALRDAMRTGRMFHSESFVLKRKDGTSYDADLTMYPVRSEEGHADENAGQVLFYVCIHRDITQKKRSEAAKSEFISLASHQLRTPLTEIRWALSGVNTDVLTDEQRDIIDAARLASVHMAETIKTMLTISSLEAGEMTADIADVPLHAMLKDVVALHDVLRRKQDVRITVQCPTDLRMRTDDQLLKEVLSNLLVNACKYTPIGGIVRVSAQEHGGTIVIEVSDTGRGIPVHDQERISQKFFRASNVTGGDQEGSGLGLHMCYALMRLLGGTIAFTSREGLGTTFTLTFPHCTS